MRLASILLLATLSVILLLCVSVHGNDGEPGDIAEPGIDAPNMDVPTPPVSSPNMDMPDTKPTPLVKPENNPSPFHNQTNNRSNQDHSTQIQQKVKTMDVSGKWLMIFDGGIDRSLDLTLWTSVGATGVMGFGTLAEDGTKDSVTASGSITKDELILVAKLAAPEHADLKYDECDLDLHNVNNTLSGTYVLRSSGQFLGKGNATAERSPSH